MTCTPITPGQFRQAKQQFLGVSDDIVQSYIDLAQVWTGGEWPDRLCTPVQVAVVCHLMTLDGLGSDPRSKNNASARSEFQSIRSGNVTLTRFRSTAERAGLSTGDWFSQTPCGQQFMVFVRMIGSGARWASGSFGREISGYAKDAYRDGWWVC